MAKEKRPDEMQSELDAKRQELEARELAIMEREEALAIRPNEASPGRRLLKAYLTTPNIAGGKNHRGLLCGDVFFPNPTADGKPVQVFFYADPGKEMPKHDYFPVAPYVKADGEVGVKQHHVTGQSKPNAYAQILNEIRISGPSPATMDEANAHGGVTGDADNGRIIGDFAPVGVYRAAEERKPAIY